MSKIKTLVNLIKASTKAQIITGAVAVTVIGTIGVGGYVAYTNMQENKENKENTSITQSKKMGNEELVKMFEDKKKEASKLLDNADLDDVNKLIEKAEWSLNNNAVEETEEAYKQVVEALNNLTDKLNEVKGKNKVEIEKKIAELKEKVASTELTDEVKIQIEAKIKEIEALLSKEEFRQAFELTKEATKLINPNVENENTEENNGSENGGGSSNNDSGSSNNDSGSSNNGGGSSNNGGGSSNNGGGSSNNGGGSSNNGGGSSNNGGGSSNNGGGNSNNGGGNSNNGGGNSNNGGGTTTPNPEPPKPQYETFNGFRYDIGSEGRQDGFIGGANDFTSMFPNLSSMSTMSSFNYEVNKAVGVLVQGAYQDTVKSKFMNKLVDGKYLITNVTIETYKVGILDGNGNLVVDPYSELVKQGIENTPGGLFSTVVGNYGNVNDDQHDYFIKCTVQFTEI